MADWKDLPEGYYAVPDPYNEGEMSYWRRKDKGKNKRPSFEPWPLKAKAYGPRLLKSDPRLIGMSRDEMMEFARKWYETEKKSYMDAVIEIIAADPIEAGKQFADWQLRCCMCGKGLTTDDSKVYGIGPECRKGMSKEFLDNYFPPQVGKLHAGYVDSA